MSNFRDAVENNLKDLSHVSVGFAHSCETCRHDFNLSEEDAKKQAESNSGVLDEGGFSWSPCESCGSTLGGNRYAAHGLDKDGNLIHIEVCEDCLCFIANGDEPGATE